VESVLRSQVSEAAYWIEESCWSGVKSGVSNGK
jgi:hypothetical protein